MTGEGLRVKQRARKQIGTFCQKHFLGVARCWDAHMGGCMEWETLQIEGLGISLDNVSALVVGILSQALYILCFCYMQVCTGKLLILPAFNTSNITGYGQCI